MRFLPTLGKQAAIQGANCAFDRTFTGTLLHKGSEALLAIPLMDRVHTCTPHSGATPFPLAPLPLLLLLARLAFPNCRNQTSTCTFRWLSTQGAQMKRTSPILRLCAPWQESCIPPFAKGIELMAAGHTSTNMYAKRLFARYHCSNSTGALRLALMHISRPLFSSTLAEAAESSRTATR